MYPSYAQSSPYDGSNRTMIVCCLFLFVCVLISVALFALGNKYATISPALFCCLCLALLALVCLHLHYRTPFRHSPPVCYFSLPSLSSTEDKQDKMHQGSCFGDQLALKTFCCSLLDQVKPRRVMFNPPD